MAPSLIDSYYVQSSGTSSDAISTPSFTPSNGEKIVVKAETWDTATSMGTPTGGSQTYDPRVTVAPGGFRPWVGIWTATISGSPGSMTISSTPSASARYSMLVERWSGAQFDATPATGNNNDSTGAANGTFTTEAADSIVSWVASDAQSLDPATRAFLHSDTDEGVRDDHVGANGVGYYARYVQATAASTNFGLSAPTGMQYCIAAIEVQAAGGTNATATPSTVAAVATVPAPTVRLSVAIAPATVTATASVPAPTLRADQTVTAAVVAATATVGVPTLRTDQTVTAATVAAVATVGAITFTSSATITPATVAAVAAVAAPTVQAGAAPAPATVAAVATVGAPAVSTGSTVTAVTVAAVATVPSPSISVGGSATVAASTVAAVAAVGAPTVAAGSVAAPVTVAAVATVGAPAVALSVLIVPTTVALVAAVGAATVSTTGSATVTVGTVTVTVAVPAPVVAVTGAVPTPDLVHVTAAPLVHVTAAPLVHVGP